MKRMTEKQLANLRPFSSTHQPKTRNTKHPNGYLMPLVYRILEKKHFRWEDPESQTIKRLLGKNAVAIQWIWSILQGDTRALKELVERTDGKVPQKLEGEGFDEETKIIIIRPGEKIEDKKDMLGVREGV